jgi:cytoskeletal protein RodZ
MKDKSPRLEPLVPHVADLRVGAMLRARRLALKFSLADVELSTKIRGRFLHSLEACDYSLLSNDIYSRGFVQSYAEFLGLDGKLVATQYQIERGKAPKALPTKARSLLRPRFVMTPRIFVALGSILAGAAVVAYLSWQFQGLSAPPKLSVASPTENQVIDGSLTQISGTVAGGSEVFVNDSPVLTDANGHFSDQLALQDGVNSVRVTAKNKLGMESVVTRNVLAKSTSIAASSGAVSTISGVRLTVMVKGGTASVSVTIDGVDRPRVTMLDGTSQTFEGTKTVRLSTTNAGATSLLVTNSIATGKQISPLGSDGQAKNNLVFDFDTVIP